MRMTAQASARRRLSRKAKILLIVLAALLLIGGALLFYFERTIGYKSYSDDPIKTERSRTNGKAGLRDVCGGSNERQRNGLLRFGRNASADAFAEALIVRCSAE